jgi:hypothetical protein
VHSTCLSRIDGEDTGPNGRRLPVLNMRAESAGPC